MRVRSADGRSIAFDLKDYAHIDHGYAATIHKAQGMTVDRVHVLATPGLDRHGAYVALPRHRDSVELHYGKDDFADRRRLVRTLSRERGKDMASDYARAPEVAPKPEPKRSIFDGLGLPAHPARDIGTGILAGRQFAAGYPADEWADVLGTGILVNDDQAGLMHYPDLGDIRIKPL